VAEFINALRQGMADQADWQQTYTRRRAGKSFASGDYGAASGILAGEGMLPEAAQMRGYGQQEQAGQDEAARKEIKDRAEWMLNGVNGLMSVPEAQRGQVFDQHLVPTLQAMGMPTDVIAKLRASPKDDATLRAFAASLGQEAAKAEYEFMNLGAGGVGRGNKMTGEYRTQREPDPIYQQLGAGETLLAIPRGGGGGGGGGAAAGAPTGSVSAPRGERNNNPGNIEDGPFAKSLPGYKGSDGRFAIFETPQAGQAAQGALLQSYGRRGINTVQAIISRWAPPSDGNPTNGYAAFVARKLGVDPSQPLDMNNPNVLQALSGAIAEFENGGAAARPAGPQVVAQGAPKPTGRMATPQERAALGIEGQSPVWIGADGKPDVLGPGGASPKDRVALRKEFEQNADVKAFNDVAASYDIISSIASAPPSAANDMSMIFAYMKMLDPGSVVREGEFATAQNSAGLPDQVRNAYNKALNGQRLAPGQREQFVSTAGTIYRSRKARYDQQIAQFQGYASDLGLDPETTIVPRIAAGPQRGGGSPRAPGQSRIPPTGVTPAQRRAAAAYKGTDAPSGTDGNPSIPVNADQYNRLPSGTVYLDANGQKRKKL
jgi:hypothetical protein